MPVRSRKKHDFVVTMISHFASLASTFTTQNEDIHWQSIGTAVALNVTTEIEHFHRALINISVRVTTPSLFRYNPTVLCGEQKKYFFSVQAGFVTFLDCFVGFSICHFSFQLFYQILSKNMKTLWCFLKCCNLQQLFHIFIKK